MPALVLGGGLIGALIGSFLNVVIYRVPARRSIVSPRSACGSCGAPIRWHDNVPILSWVLLRGRCRDCAAGISMRYPLIELGTALFFALVVWWAVGPGMANPWTAVTSIAFLYLSAISVVLTMIDLDTHTLPNRIVLPAYPVGAILLGVASLLGAGSDRLLTAAAGAAALFGLYFLLAIAYPGGMGFGDVKLAGVIGLYLGWLGWAELAVGAFAAFLLGGVFSVVLLLARRANRRTAIPFGPWMIMGTWVGILAGDAIAAAYLLLFGLT